jgi:hypothetical protein
VEPSFDTAIPHRHLSIEFATLTSSTGFGRTLPLTILFTIPVSFSSTKISSGPTKAMVVGVLNPSAIVVIFRFESKSFGFPCSTNSVSANFS